MTRRLRFVETASEVGEAEADTRTIVLDPAWTPLPGDRPDVLAARRLLGAVVERVDLFDGALALVDGWAERTAIADRLVVEDVTYWFRLRETMWRWAHERLLWRHALAALDDDPGAAIVAVEVPAAETAIADVARRLWPAMVVSVRPAEAEEEPPAPAIPPPDKRVGRGSAIGRLARALRLRLGASRTPRPGPPNERTRREATLARRVADIVADDSARVLLLTNPATHQRVGRGGNERQDPLFGAIIPGLSRAGIHPILLATGIDHRQDADWALVEADDRLLPQQLLRSRWSRPEDDDRRADAVEASLRGAIDAIRDEPFDLVGVDLGRAFVAALEAIARPLIRRDVHMLARAERLIAELAPAAIVLAQEGIRTPWLMAAKSAAIPVFAVQHGILYPGHAGYPNRRHDRLVVPTRTFVYGEDEAAVLMGGAYLPTEVEVVGSPRLDLDLLPVDATTAAAERRAVRAELGVQEGDRLLVVSTVNLRFVQRSHFVHMLEAVLGGPLPGTHVVFKQHPGERDAGPYRDLLLGLARAGGYAPPPISVVKDTDLYRLLRAADAHLGLLSTVLTDAVAAGTPNLIAMTDAHADLLSYVAAGVAIPVRTSDEVVAALAAIRPPSDADRTAFLAAHVRPGDASARVVAAVAAQVAIAGAGRRTGDAA